MADVAHTRGVEIQLEKIEDMKAIMSYGILSTPGVAIDEKAVHAGGIPTRAKVEGWL
ncbi:MAG: thioredoxin family protein [Sulfuritalea sp.]|nr:thioredoxin family protein [Sulfuritalea sp.]